MRERMRMVCPFLLLALTVCGQQALADEPAATKSPALPDGVPPPLPPSEAIKSFTIAAGLKMEIVASEPTVEQPVSISFDDRGRLWVLEYLQYPTPSGLKPVEVDQYLRTKYDRVPDPPPKGPKGIGRVIILENPFERDAKPRAKEFLTGLDLATGMALGYDGLYVIMAPYLLFYPDKDHDDRPDGDPEVLLSGFGINDAHSVANSLTWGPDGWLYGAQGSTVTAKVRGVEFQQGTWRYHPVKKAFELFAEGGGNNWGIDFDRNGQLFVGGNTTEPLLHHVQGGYYWKGFAKHGPLHNPYTFGYIDPVKHHGFLGSALTGGFVIYQGGLFPERFKDAVIYPNLRANAMRVSKLVPHGSTFDTHFQEDFITSTDRWFRPVKNLVGPDGALWVADWYDYNISHTDPKDRSKWYQPSKDTGRIWRVFPKGTSSRTDGRWPLADVPSDYLVDLLAHPNEWYAREARRILMERRDKTICPRLERMVREATEAKPALEALWALYVSGGFNDRLALEFLDHPVDHVRAWTIRLLGDERTLRAPIPQKLVAHAKNEPSATVRNQLACTCKRLPGAQGLPIVDQLLGHAEDAADVQIPLLLWWAIEDKALSDRERVLALVDSAEKWQRPLVRKEVVGRMARRYLAEGKPEDYAACARILTAAPSADDTQIVVAALEEQMQGLHFAQAPEALATALRPLLDREKPSPALVRLAARLGMAEAIPLAEARALDKDLQPDQRAAFIRTLGELKHIASEPRLRALLEPAQPVAVRAAALQALTSLGASESAQAILAQYAQLPPALKAQARDALIGRPAWCALLLEQVASGAMAPAEFSPEQIRHIVLHDDKDLTARAEKIWGQVRPANSREKRGRIEAVTGILAKGKGDPARGKALVVKTCLNCHTLFGEGEKVGPDLSAVDRKNLDVLLLNVVDPSAIIREGYQQFVVATNDGRVLSGLIADNDAEKLVVLDAKNVRTTLTQKEVESTKKADSSLMPEGLLEPFTDQELCDLFAYLRSEPAQVAGGR